MVILLPFIESDRLKNGSIITTKQLLLSCHVTAHYDAGRCLEENKGVTTVDRPTP